MLVFKVYDRTNTTLKETIQGTLLLWDITFTANANWGQWQATFEVAKSITNTDYTLWDIIKVLKYDDNNKTWVWLYMWYITKIWRKQTTTRQYIELSCLWMASLLTEHDTTVVYSSRTVWEIVRGLIDDLNSQYWWNVLNYTLLTIPDWQNMGVWQIDKWTMASALTNLADATGSKRFVDWNWTVYFLQKPTVATHYLTNQEDVESIDIEEDIQEMVNSVHIVWPSSYADYSDAVSVATYWTKFYTEEVKIDWHPAIDNYAQQYVNDRKDTKKETTLTINRKYNIESIKPWDTVKVRNFEYPFDNIQIEKIQYTQDKITIYLDRYISFWEQIKKLL